MSLIDLDQYWLRSWLGAPFVGLATMSRRSPRPLCCTPSGSAPLRGLDHRFTLPLGVAAALAAHNKMPALGLIRSLFLLPYVIPAFVTSTVWRTMLQPGGAVDHSLALFGVTAPVWLNGSGSFWTMILVDSWSSWPFIYLLCLAGLQALNP